LLGVVSEVDLGEIFRVFFRIDHSALLIVGMLDDRTPMSEQDEVTAQFTRKTRMRSQTPDP
jgi:hypothetical protein